MIHPAAPAPKKTDVMVLTHVVVLARVCYGVLLCYGVSRCRFIFAWEPEERNRRSDEDPKSGPRGPKNF